MITGVGLTDRIAEAEDVGQRGPDIDDRICPEHQRRQLPRMEPIRWKNI